MEIIDSFVVTSSITDVWDFLLDVEEMAHCVPGVESVTLVEEGHYDGTLAIKIGPIKASFSGSAIFQETIPPERMVAVVEAKDKSSKSLVKAIFSANLKSVTEGTEVAYIMDIQLRGKMAQFGSAVVKATAKKMTADFSKCLQISLTERGAV